MAFSVLGKTMAGMLAFYLLGNRYDVIVCRPIFARLSRMQRSAKVSRWIGFIDLGEEGRLRMSVVLVLGYFWFILGWVCACFMDVTASLHVVYQAEHNCLIFILPTQRSLQGCIYCNARTFRVLNGFKTETNSNHTGNYGPWNLHCSNCSKKRHRQNEANCGWYPK